MWVECGKLAFASVLLQNVLVGDGVNETTADEADGGFKTNLGFRHRNFLAILVDELAVDAAFFERYLWIDERVGLAVVKLVAPRVRIFLPVYLDLLFIKLWLEWLCGLSHGYPAKRLYHDVVLVGYHEDIGIAECVGVIFGLSLSVSVPHVAVLA